MKKYIILLFFQFSVLLNYAQLNITQVGHLDYQVTHNSGTSNLWGYVDELGNEYAIVGCNRGTSIVNINNPANPVEVFFIPDSNSIWREVKVWNDYAYITTEEEVGMMIIDLSPLPGSTALTVTRFFGPSGNQWTSEHSLFIDENGILYVNGANRGNGGVIFYDLNIDPINPPEVGQYDAHYVHDCYARGDTLYAAHIVDGFFSILDISDKANPVLLATQTTPNLFTHNCWITDDAKYVFTTDEVGGAYIASYDISNFSNITLVDQTQSNFPGSGSIPHNVYWMNGFLITSYYRDGVTIHDATDPTNLILTGHIDVSPLSGNGFNSIWGVYPYLPSGLIIASDIENGLYIFDPTYVQGAYLHGTITNSVSLAPIFNATATIINQTITDFSNLNGEYHSGIAGGGTFDIAFYKPGFERDTVYGVVLTAGDTVVVDIALVPLVPITISGQVTEQGSGTPIANAEIVFTSSQFEFITTSDASGNYMITNAFEDVYEAKVGHWGHWTYCSDGNNFVSSVNTFNVELPKGYYDDFTFDFGWSVINGATAGNWVRAIPIATGLPNGTASNPHFDVNNDCDAYAYVTGNGPGSVGTHDVDGNPTILTSPIFDATLYTDPWVGYAHWFFNTNQGFVTPANDTMTIWISNGTNTVLVERIMANNFPLSQWVDTTWQISAYVTPTANMTLILSIADYDATGGNLCEGAIDRFYVSEGNTQSTNELEQEIAFSVYPNPAQSEFTIRGNSMNEQYQLELYDLSGKIVMSRTFKSGESISIADLSNGMYILSLKSKTHLVRQMKIIKY